jgi:hypothetical protein
MKGAGDGGNGIKYIGQHVFDFVSSFRNTVNIGTDALDADLFLNDLSNLTSSLPADGKVLHIDSNNKVGFRTFAQLIADLGGGDITSVSVTDGANEHTKTSGAFALVFTAGDGIGLGLTGSSTGATNGTLTISVPDSGIDASAKLTNAVPVANGGTGTNTLTSGGILVGNGTGPVSNFGSKFSYTDSDTFSIVADTIRVSSANDGDPQLNLINTNDGAVPPSLNFTREPADNAGADGDEIGRVNYVMDDSAGNATTFVQTNGLIDVATNGQESGRYVVQVASHDAELQIGLDIVGGSAEDEIDVTIASGAASVTTIEGTLTMGSTAFVNNSGVIQVATQGTIDHDSLANFVAAEHYRWDNDISATATINAANIPTLNQNTSGTAAGLSSTLAVGSGGTGATSLTPNAILKGNSTSAIQAESGLTYVAETLSIGDADSGEAIITRLAPTDPGSGAEGGDFSIKAGRGIGTNKVGGDLNLYGGASTGAAGGGKIAFFAAPGGGGSGSGVVSHTEVGSISSAGALQIDGGITTGSTSFVNSSGVVQVATQGTIDHDSLANFVAAEHYRWDTDISGTATIHTNNITDLHGAGIDGSANQLLTDDGDGTVTSETDLTFSSGALAMQSSSLQIFTLKRTSTGSDNDTVGVIRFTGNDDADNSLRYAAISAKIIDASDGAEEGQLNLAVASHDGEEVTGLSLTSGDAEDEVDVTIGNGTTSLTTVAGDLTVTSNLTADNVRLPGGGTISFDDSLDGTDQFITGTDSNLTIDGDDKIKLRADTQIEVKSTSNADTVIITNNSGNIYTAGDIELGHASDTTIARSAAGTVTIEGNQIVTENKQLHVIPCSFFDDIGTTKHYIPISSQSTSEQTSDGNTLTDFLVPCSTKVKEVMVKLPGTTTGSGDLTIGIETSSIGASVFSKSIVETETVAVADSNDNDIVHFMFDDTTHATIGQNLSISIQAASDLSSSQNWYIVAILEFDWSTRHTSSSAIQTS